MTKSSWFWLIAAGVLLAFGALVIKAPTTSQSGQASAARQPARMQRADKTMTPAAGSAATDAPHCDGPEACRAAAATAAAAPAAPSADQRFSRALDDLVEQVKRAREPRSPAARANALSALAAAELKLDALHASVQRSFAATERTLVEQRAPELLRARHRDMVRAFGERRQELHGLLAEVTAKGVTPTRRAAGLARLGDFFAQHRQARSHTPLDAGQLPFRPASAEKTRAPATRSDDPRLVAALGSALTFSASPPAAPQPADLAASADVQLTPRVQALAASLHHNPVEIFNWVRNQVEWLPTYGSVQGSELTLISRRGNSFDTASLLIALLRASGISSRYVYGTIEVPVSRMLNWVGGATRPEAAQQILGQGGIPNLAMILGSTVKTIRMEHVWVEAFVDYEPSRGAVQRSSDTWLALDPSFKQHELAPPLDWKNAVGADPAQLGAQLAAGAAYGPDGSLTGLDNRALTTLIDTTGAALAEQLPIPERADLVGTRNIIAEERSVLPASLPNKVITRSGSFAAIPANLRHSVTLQLYASELDEALGSTSLSYTAELPAIANKRLGVSYVPATAADATALASYRQTPVGSLPLYLFKLRPVVQLDGVEVARGPAVTMGEAQSWNVRLNDPSAGLTHQHAYSVAAGAELVFGVNGNGVSTAQIEERFAQTASDTAAENLYTIALYYWAQHDTANAALAASTKVLVNRLPSIGLFSAPLTVEYMFGLPRSGFYSPQHMDVAHSIVAAAEYANGSTVEFHRNSGLIGSLLEGRTFDGLLQREAGSGVSAVQLLREANEQGIPIHLVHSENYDELAPSLHVDADILADVRSAVLQGKQVLIPQRAPFHGNWQGLGYIVEDPSTGAGAYMISGGLAGGGDDPCEFEPVREPVTYPIRDILLAIAIVAAIILICILMPEIIAAIAAGLGRLAPVLLRLGGALGMGAAPAMAAAQKPSYFPGDGMKAPGDCTWAVYLALKAEVDRLCHGAEAASCKNFVGSCDELRRRYELTLACAQARETRETTCFKGGNEFHWDQKTGQWNAVARCTCMLADQGCN